MDKWVSIASKYVDALYINGYHRRSYYYDKFFRTYRGWNNEYNRFILIVYQNEHDQMCEIRKMDGFNKSSSLKPDVLKKMFDGYVGIYGESMKNAKFEVINGRAFIHGTFNRYDNRYDIKNICRLIGGKIVENLGWELSVGMKWDLPSYEDIATVNSTLNDLYYNLNDINDKWHENRKKNVMIRISELRTKVENLRNDMDKTCEKSADAMNILSEKYGIDLSI